MPFTRDHRTLKPNKELIEVISWPPNGMLVAEGQVQVMTRRPQHFEAALATGPHKPSAHDDELITMSAAPECSIRDELNADMDNETPGKGLANSQQLIAFWDVPRCLSRISHAGTLQLLRQLLIEGWHPALCTPAPAMSLAKAKPEN